MKKLLKMIAVITLMTVLLPIKAWALNQTMENNPAAKTPVIAFTTTPKYGEEAPFLGIVFNEDGSSFDPSEYRMALWIEYSGLWPKPTYDQPYTDLNDDGSFTYLYCTSTNDKYSKTLHFFLIPSDYKPASFEETKAKAFDYVKVERDESGSITLSPARTAPEPMNAAPAIASGLLPVKKEKIAVDVGFYTVDGTAPDQALNDDLIRAHLTAVSKFADTVRFYKATGPIERAYVIARELGLNVLGNAYLSKDKTANKKELDGLIRLCNEGYCKIAVVGNEVLLNSFLTAKELVEAIEYVRAGITVKTFPVTTSENYDQLLATPSVRNACNLILVNHYTFLGGDSIDTAAKDFINNINTLKAVCSDKELVIAETGWPTAGKTIHAAVPNEANAAKYYADIRDWSIKNNIQVCYFESTDESWKGQYEGEHGKHWGFMTNDFDVKDCYQNLNPFNLNVEVTSVTVSPKNLVLYAGETSSLAASVSPKDAADKSLTWESSNASIAAVDRNGKVTAVSKGYAYITATSINGKSDTCEVQVKTIEPTGITLENMSLTLTVGETHTLKAEIQPANATVQTIRWNSSDPSVATIDNTGRITALKPGMTRIQARVYNEEELSYKSAICVLNVMPRQQGKHPVISLTKTPAIGDGSDFEGTVYMEDGSNCDASQYRISCWLYYGGNLYPKPYYGRAYADINNDGSFSVKYNTGGNDKDSPLLYFLLIPKDHSPEDFEETSEMALDCVRVERSEDGTVTVIPDRIKQSGTQDPAACRSFGFCMYKGKQYWYENWQRQGTMSDPKNIIGDGSPRGREIYDAESDGWYWLDSIYDGAKAEGKEVWVPYIYQGEDKWSDSDKRKIAYESDNGMGEFVYQCIKNKTGKWVRYDGNGKMLKGWVTIHHELATIYPEQYDNTYYYDTRTGLMAKGWITIDGTAYHFDEITGALIR